MRKLKKEGILLPFADSQIAAIALENRMTLATKNTKDFVQITEYFPLKLENWWE